MKSYTLLNKFFQSNLKVIEIFLYSNSKYTMYIIGRKLNFSSCYLCMKEINLM